jgi:serine/threonine protein kinase
LQLAIKVDNLQVEGAFKSFDAECEVLRNIRHQNLVKIISSCSNNDFKALVLEYVAQGEFGEVVVFCRPLFGYSTDTEHHDRCFMGIGISALRSFNTHCWL